MARQTRQKTSPARRAVRPATPPTVSRSRAGARSAKAGRARPRRSAATAPAAGGTSAAPAVPTAPRKPGYYEALAMYESGVRGLQRHDYEGAAHQFRTIIERYPEERELQERSHLYLRVCERETARRPPTPQTPQERVYAATVSLNAGDPAAAVDHLRRALGDAPDSDHAHYIMSVALAALGSASDALEHLRRAITLNPENRGLARQDPDLEPLRSLDPFAALIEGQPARNRLRKRR